MNIENDPVVQDQRRKVRRRFAIGGVVLLAACLLASQWYPLICAARGWRSKRLAAAAERLLEKKSYPEAFVQAQSAYFLKPDGARAIAAVAKVLSAMDRTSEAIPFWRKLSEIGPIAHADRLTFASDLLRAGALPEAARAVATLEAEEPSNPAVLRLAAQVHAGQGQLAEAIGRARRSVERAPGDLESQLLLAVLLTQSNDRTDRDVAQRTLRQISADPGEHGLRALELLTRSPELPASEGAALAEHLRNHPKARQEQRLLALELLIRLEPDEKLHLLDRAMAEYEHADAAARRAFGIWLNTQGEHERTLKIVPLEESFSRKDLLLVHLDALSALNRWDDVQQLLNRPNIPLEEVYRQVFLARCALQKNDPMSADSHWLRARNEARSTPALLWFVGGYAEKAGQRAPAEAAYRLLVENAATRRAACEALLRLAVQKGDTIAVRDLLAEIHGYFPDDVAVENDYAYMSLLTGKDLEASRDIAERLRARAPENLAHRTTLALAQCLLQQPEAALRAYEGLQIPWEKVPMSQRAIHALALGVNGRAAEAREEVRALHLEALRPEEKKLIAPWIDT